MKNIIKRGINSNMLKTIAIIAMVIDHIGFYFSTLLPNSVYTIFRGIGRIAMPIFVYLLVQGFFHTKDFKKYIYRIGGLAFVTQLLLTILMFVNIKCVPDYIAAKQAYTTGNILFTFVISLGIMKILHEDVLVRKWDYNKNISLKIITVITIIIISSLLPIDYNMEVPCLSIFLYYIERFKIQLYLEKVKGTNNIKNMFLNTTSESKLMTVYVLLILLAFVILIIYFGTQWQVLFAIIPIALYNGERGRTNLKYLYYIFFPLHESLLYLLAMIVTLT